jgi:hypothetical protein
MKSVAPALTLLAALLLAGPVHAQTSPAKKELVAKLLKLQQPGIETLARGLVEQPAAQMMQQASIALQTRVAPEKREAIGKEIQADVKKYVDDNVPLLRDRATKLAPTTVGAILEEKFTEDELKQIIAIMENPVNRKFQQMGADMQRSLAEKLVAETRPTIEPKVKALEQSIVARLGITPVAAPAIK